MQSILNSTIRVFGLAALIACAWMQTGQPTTWAQGDPKPGSAQEEAVQVTEVKDLQIGGPNSRIALTVSPAAQAKAQSLGFQLTPVPQPPLAQEVSLATSRRKWKITIEIRDVKITISGGKNARLGAAQVLPPNPVASVLTIIDGDKRFETILVAERGNLENVKEFATDATAAAVARGGGGGLNRWWSCFRNRMSGTGCGATCVRSILACAPRLRNSWTDFFKCVANRCGSCWTQAAWQAAWACV